MHLRRLHERELRVTSAGRHVDEEVVGLTPGDIAQELGDDLHDDRPAPDRWRIPLHHEADAHELHAVRLERNDALVLHRRRLIDPHHARDVRPVDVGVHEADARTGSGERDGDVGRDSRLPHATLAARDGNDVAQIGIRFGCWSRPHLRARRSVRSPRVDHRQRTTRRRLSGLELDRIAHVDAHVGDTIDPLHCAPNLSGQGWIVGAGEEKRQAHPATDRRPDVTDHLCRKHVGAEPRVLDASERVGDPLLERVGHTGNLTRGARRARRGARDIAGTVFPSNRAPHPAPRAYVFPRRVDNSSPDFLQRPGNHRSRRLRVAATSKPASKLVYIHIARAAK
jgi:hypothetical protein